MKNSEIPAFLWSTGGTMYVVAIITIIITSIDPISRYGGFFVSMTIFVPVVYPIYLGSVVIDRRKGRAGTTGVFRRLRAQVNIVAVGVTYSAAVMWWLMAGGIIGVEGFRVCGPLFISLPVVAYLTSVAMNMFIMNCTIGLIGRTVWARKGVRP